MTNWADFGIDLSVTNLSKEELEFYNSGGKFDEDRYGRKKKFPMKAGKWVPQVEWSADLEELGPFDPKDFMQLLPEASGQEKS